MGIFIYFLEGLMQKLQGIGLQSHGQSPVAHVGYVSGAGPTLLLTETSAIDCFTLISVIDSK